MHVRLILKNHPRQKQVNVFPVYIQWLQYGHLMAKKIIMMYAEVKGKDYIKRFCEFLKQSKMKIINFEKKKLISFTNKEYHILIKQTFTFTKKSLTINTLMIKNTVELETIVIVLVNIEMLHIKYVKIAGKIASKKSQQNCLKGNLILQEKILKITNHFSSNNKRS